MFSARKTFTGMKDELILYSGQYALFYIVMNFCKDRSDYFSDLGHVLLIFVLLIQTLFLIYWGDRILYRILGSLIAPLMYTIIEFELDFQFILNSAHVFFWIFSIFVGTFQALQLKIKSTELKKINETVITSINILMFLFIYFYFDLYIDAKKDFISGLITQREFDRHLDVTNLINNLRLSLEDPTHVYILIGGIFLTLSIVIGKIEIIKLNEKIKELFGRYVDKNIRDKILTDGIGRSEKRDLCILFSDIRNFSSVSEMYTPKEITNMLNFYFSEWSDTAKKYHGIIDKFIGDAVMIVFEHEKSEMACRNAVLCATEMLGKMNSINSNLEKNNLPVIEGIGVGVHFGDVIAGDIGSVERANYTYIGDNVNVASRLESLTKQIGKKILITQDVYEMLSTKFQGYFSKIEQAISLKGKKNVVSIYYLNNS